MCELPVNKLKRKIKSQYFVLFSQYFSGKLLIPTWYNHGDGNVVRKATVTRDFDQS